MRELISKLKKLQVSVQVVDNALDIEAPEGVLTEALLDEIRANKQELIDFIRLYQRRNDTAGTISKIAEQASYALSAPQKRIWILSQFKAVNVAYNMPGAYEFSGPLDPKLLSSAFDQVIDRHDTLRTVFREDETGEIRQFVQSLEETRFSISFRDLEYETDPMAILPGLLKDLTIQPFDLKNGPMLSATLFKLGAEKHMFFFNMHHIISDGWSMGVLLNELVLCYNAALSGNSPELPELRIQYKDYASWQWDQLTGGKLESHKSYWLNQFADDIPLLEIPSDKVRPPLKTNNGAMVNGILGAEIVDKLSGLIRAEGGTLFMGLLAGVKALLYRYSGQEDIVIGSPVAGRDDLELQHQIGFYINTLALRTQFSGQADFLDLYRRVRDVALAGFEHQVYPFDELVDELDLKRDLSRSALFDVMVAIQNNEDEARELKLGDVEITQYQTGHITSKFDLIFNFSEVKDELHYTIEYNTDIYSEAQIVRMRTHFENLMAFVIKDAEVPLDKIDFLSQEEKAVISDYNHTEVSYPEGNLLYEPFVQQVSRTPDQTALVFDGEKMSYRELYEKASRLANYLQKLGDQLNQPIPIISGKGPGQIWGVLGILMAGAHYIPVKGGLPKARINELIAQTEAAVVLAEAKYLDKVESRDGLETVLLEEDTFQQEAVEHESPKAAETDLAYIIFTSGSTGKPKGVMIDHRGAVNTLYDMNARFNVTEKDRVFGISDLNFDLSVYDIFGVFACGATLVIPKEDEVQDADIWLDYIEKEQITVWNSVPQLVNLLVDAQYAKAGNPLAHIRLYLMSGDWIPVGLPGKIREVRADADVISLGGATEGSIWSIHYPIGEVDPNWKSIPYGFPLGNQEMHVLNGALEPCPYNIPGDIYIGGKGVAKGYYKDQEKTSASFMKHPVQGTALYRTGDQGAFHPDGYINFLGRLDGQVKIRGYRIELGEIESALQKYPAIDTCIISTTPLTGKDRDLVAYMVSKDILSTTELVDYLGEFLPDYMVPTYFVQLDQLPLTANGKVDKKALPDPASAGLSAEREFVPPVTDTQKQLVTIWSEILSVDTQLLGIEDNFFELGGHSLRVTQLRGQMSKTFGVDFKINELFTLVTIHDQADHIDQAVQTKHVSIPVIEPADYYLLSSAQRRLWVLSQFEATNIAYNIPATFEIGGNADRRILQEAFGKLIQRHEILRTVFNTREDGEVYQFINDPEEVDFEIGYEDLSTETDINTALEEALTTSSVQPFDLAAGPLLRATLYQVDKERQVLFFTMHHIIGDGWSLEVLLSELLAYYTALKTGEDPALKPLSIQYKDYAAWQRSQMEGELLEQHKGYWLNQFSGQIPVLELPTDFIRPSVQTHTGGAVNGVISADTTSKFQDLMNASGSTLFMGLLAAVNALFYRYTGQEDIIIGSPVAGRDHADLEEQIGLYIGMLALRARFEANDSFTTLLDKVKTVTLDAYDHQAYPFDELVAELDLKRDTSRSALFDVVLILHNNSKKTESLDLAGVPMKVFDLDQTTSKFDITFNFTEIDEGLEYTIEYNGDIYSASQMERMALHLDQLLSSVTEQSELAIRDMAYLNQEEERQLLTGFNDTKTDYPADDTIVSLFESQVKVTPENIALVFQNTEWTYAELDEKANQLAHELIRTGTQKGDLVGIYTERSAYMLAAMLGVMKAGAAYVPLDPAYPQDRIAYVIEDAEIKTMLVQRKVARKLPDFNGKTIIIDQHFDTPTESVDLALSANNLAYAIYTSGSTGKPKGVLVEHGNVVNFFTGMDQEIGRKEQGNSLLAVTTMSFDISVLELLWTVSNGFKVVIQPTQHFSTVGGGEQVEVSTKKMDFSLFYFASEVDPDNKYKLLIEGARFGDKNGFSAIWTPERHFHEFGGIYPNPAVTGAAIATITENIQIRSGSCVLPLHNPIRVAEEWSVVDNLSNGRVGLSFASGWVMNDFLAFSPGTYEKRHKVLYEGIETVKDLWKGGSIELENPTGPNASVEIHPKPLQKELPIWVTAAGNPETFRSAGKLGANLLTHLLGQTVEELHDKIEVYREAWKEAGHPGEGHVTLMIHTFIEKDVAVVKEKVRAPFTEYLRNSWGLLRSLGKSIGQDVDDENFKEADLESLLDHAFNRYFDSAALFGTPDSCLNMVNKLSNIGVDELGCLVDFGLDADTTMNGFHHLNDLKKLYEEQAFEDGEELLVTELISKHQITHLQCTPSALKMMLMEPDAHRQMQSISELMIGGEALPADLVTEVQNRLQASVHNMYGPTETTIWSTTKHLKKGDRVTIGNPIANTQIRILDKHLNLVPIGVTGDLYIGGAGVTRGYLKRPELTDERFITSPFNEQERLYKTGDLAKWLRDGDIEFLGRGDDQVKIRGHRIELGEIEAALRTGPVIKDAVVHTTINAMGDDELAAYLISEQELNVTELRSLLAQQLPAYMVPGHFVQLDEFPLTPNGKINKRALPDVGESLGVQTEYVAPRTHDEERLAEAWSELLEVDKDSIGIHHNFFELGGQSLSAIRLMGIVNQELNIRIPLSLIFENPTIYEFVTWLKMHRHTSDPEESSEFMEMEEII